MPPTMVIYLVTCPETTEPSDETSNISLFSFKLIFSGLFLFLLWYKKKKKKGQALIFFLQEFIHLGKK
jgi:hypothetical protein